MSEASLASRVNQNLGVQLMLQRFLPLQTKARLAATESHHAIEFDKLKKYLFSTKNTNEYYDGNGPQFSYVRNYSFKSLPNINLDNGKKFLIYFNIVNFDKKRIARLNVQLATKLFYVDFDEPKMFEQTIGSNKFLILKFKSLNDEHRIDIFYNNEIKIGADYIYITFKNMIFKDYNFDGIQLNIQTLCDLSNPDDNYKATKLVNEFKEIIRKYDAGELERSS